MKDMKRTAKEQKATAVGIAEPSKDEYPYGLRISLQKSELVKLGMKNLPKVGDEFQIEAKAKVVSVRASDHAEYGDDASCELQITDLALDNDDEPASKKLYGKTASKE